MVMNFGYEVLNYVKKIFCIQIISTFTPNFKLKNVILKLKINRY